MSKLPVPPCPKLHYTHPCVATELLKDINFSDDDFTLEPCYGAGAIYNLIPGKKDWAEIEANRDFFKMPFKANQFTKVILNPPYASNHIKGDKNRKMLTFPFIFRSLELCSDEVWVLLNNAMLNSFTPNRFEKCKDAGFGLVFMRVLNIPNWSGRYYWLCFKKGGENIVSWTNYITMPKNKCECGVELIGDLTSHKKTHKHWVNMIKLQKKNNIAS
tara:strand:- start:1178 stop:1825 length:648 start_codon:yes stop_codon:yes gene_type:complete